MMEHEQNDVLADRLARHATQVDVGTPMLDVVVQRGRQRQQRRRSAVSVVTVGAVCAATIVTINLLSQPTERTIITGTPGTATRPSADTAVPGLAPRKAQLVDSNLVWNRVDPDGAEAISMFGGYSNARVAGHGPFVAWSTSPGLADGTADDYRAVLWRSDDGQSWQQVEGLDLGGMANGGVAERDGRFFAYGTTPAQSTADGRSADLAYATSDDGGLTWATQNLPVDTSDLADQPGVASVDIVANAIVAGADGVLALARVSVSLDPDVLPADARNYGYNTTPDGIVVNHPGSCDSTPSTTVAGAGLDCGSTSTTIVIGGTGPTPTNTVPTSTSPVDTAVVGTAPATDSASTLPLGANTTVPGTTSTMTWADLGIGQTVVEALASPLRVYFSPDGSEFTEVKAPPATSTAQYSDMRLTAVDGGFVTQVMTYDTAGPASAQLFQTADGQTWTDLGPSPIPGPDSFGSMNGSLVISGVAAGGRNPGTTSIAVRSPDGTWTVVALNDLTLPTDGVVTSLGTGGIVAGPTGISLLANLYVDPVAEIGGVDVTHDGITMHASDYSGSFTFVDEGGEELGRVEQYGHASGLVTVDHDTGSYQVRRDTDGPVVATFTNEEFSNTASALVDDQTAPATFVLHSTDGVNWSREPLTDLAGAAIFGSGGVRLTDTQIIVAANLEGQKNTDGTPKQTLLIGTPAG
jgi:hypothetical protein